jgi:hypothetical protein
MTLSIIKSQENNNSQCPTECSQEFNDGLGHLKSAMTDILLPQVTDNMRSIEDLEGNATEFRNQTNNRLITLETQKESRLQQQEPD